MISNAVSWVLRVLSKDVVGLQNAILFEFSNGMAHRMNLLLDDSAYMFCLGDTPDALF